MKALLISYFFPPSRSAGGLRAFSLCKNLPEKDIEVILLTSETELKDNKKLQQEYKLEEVYFCKRTKLREWGYKTKILAGLELLKLDKFLFFPDIYFPWVKKAIKIGKKAIEESKPDFILVTAPPFSVFKAALKLSKQYKLPLVLDYRDPWNGSPYIMYPNNLIKKRYLRAEKKIVAEADLLVTIGDECAKLISDSIDVPTDDIAIIHNGYIKERIPEDSSQDKNSIFTLTIAGSLFLLLEKTFNVFLSGFSKFVLDNKLSPDEVQIQYAGGTSRKTIGRALDNTAVHEYFHDLGFLENEDYYSVLSKSHLLVHLLPNRTEYAIATRLYDYFNSNSHVLIVGNEGGPSRICKEIDQSFSIVNEKVGSISEKLSDLYKDWKINTLEYGSNLELIQSFDRRNLTHKYAKLLKNWFNEIKGSKIKK